MTAQVEELVTHLKSLSDEELRELATTPEWALLMHKVYWIRPEEELTTERIVMWRMICRAHPASTEFYETQVELNRQRHQYSRVAGAPYVR